MSSPSDPVLLARHEAEGGAILQITINRPEVHNAVNGAAARMLLEAWRAFRDDASLVVAVLHGAGQHSFCAGADLKALGSLAQIGATREEVAAFVEHGTGPMGGTRIVQTKPVITVSQGYTYAGGLELFCHGHIRLAEPAATFSVACRRWGVPLVDGGTVYLPRIMGWGAALPLIITGQRITAERAYEIGLVWELVPEGGGLARAMDVARQICQQPRRRDAGRSELRDPRLAPAAGGRPGAGSPKPPPRHAQRKHPPRRRSVPAREAILVQIIACHCQAKPREGLPWV
jgi:enoyl-CoA hydratase